MMPPAELIDRYRAVWHERDAAARRESIAALWTPDGARCNSQLDACGYHAIEKRVAGAHEKWVRDAGHVFRPRRSSARHHNVMRFDWEMVPAAGGDVVAAGVNVLILGPDGRIRSDYQFSEPPTPTAHTLTGFVERYVAFWNEAATPLLADGLFGQPQLVRDARVRLAARARQHHASALGQRLRRRRPTSPAFQHVAFLVGQRQHRERTTDGRAFSFLSRERSARTRCSNFFRLTRLGARSDPWPRAGWRRGRTDAGFVVMFGKG